MSHAALKWAYAQKTGSPLAKAILVRLADRANDKEGYQCWTSVGTLSDETEISRRAVVMQIAALEAAGFIEVEHRRVEGKNLPNLYRLMVGKERRHSAPDALPIVHHVHHPRASKPSRVVHDVHHPSAPHAPGVVHHVHPILQREPPLNPPIGEISFGERGVQGGEFPTLPLDEPTPTPAPEKPTRRRAVPDDWQPAPRTVTWAADRYPGLDWGFELGNFRNHHIAKGTLFADIDAGFRKWCTNAATDFGRKPISAHANGPVRPSLGAAEWDAVVAAYFGHMGQSRAGRWSSGYGPKPGEPGCFAPAHLVERYRRPPMKGDTRTGDAA